MRTLKAVWAEMDDGEMRRLKVDESTPSPQGALLNPSNLWTIAKMMVTTADCYDSHPPLPWSDRPQTSGVDLEEEVRKLKRKNFNLSGRTTLIEEQLERLEHWRRLEP
tara:strand:+ start:377 stop:700 length:324 start_codon:yes stop_codon:yes gene_type:complete